MEESWLQHPAGTDTAERLGVCALKTGADRKGSVGILLFGFDGILERTRFGERSSEKDGSNESTTPKAARSLGPPRRLALKLSVPEFGQHQTVVTNRMPSLQS